MEKFNRRTLLHFMSTEWKILAGELMLTNLKSLTGEIYDISCRPWNGNVSLERSTIFHIHQVENFSWRSLFNLYFISTKLKILTREPYDILCPKGGRFQLGNSILFHIHEVEKFNWTALRYFMSTKRKCLTGDLYDISCPRNGKSQLENSAIIPVHEVEKSNWRD